MSAKARADAARSALQSLEGWHDLLPDQLTVYKLLRLEEIDAREKIESYLDGLLPEPLSEEQRKTIYARRRDEYLSANTGDGMDEDRADAEVEAMSDWEFYNNFVEGGDLDDRM